MFGKFTKINLLFACLLMAGYLAFGFVTGLPFHERFLGNTARWNWPAWVNTIFGEALVMFPMLLWQSSSPKGEGAYRFLVGGLGAGMLLFGIFMPWVKADVFGHPFPTLDHKLAAYIWGSHVLFGLSGLSFYIGNESVSPTFIRPSK